VLRKLYMNRINKYLMKKINHLYNFAQHISCVQEAYEITVRNHFMFIIKSLRNPTNSVFTDFFFA